MIRREWKRRESGPGRRGGGGSQARAGGGRQTESSPPAPPARSHGEIPESGAHPSGDKEPGSWRQSRRRAPRSGGGRGLCAPRTRRAVAGRLPPTAWGASEPGAARTSSPPRRVRHGSRGQGPSGGERGSPPITEVGRGRPGADPAWVARGSKPRGGCRREEEEGRLRGGGQGPQERRRVRAGARSGRSDAPPRRGEPVFGLLLPPPPPALPRAEKKTPAQWVQISRPGIQTPAAQRASAQGSSRFPAPTPPPARSAQRRHRSPGARRQKAGGRRSRRPGSSALPSFPSARLGSPLCATTNP